MQLKSTYAPVAPAMAPEKAMPLSTSLKAPPEPVGPAPPPPPTVLWKTGSVPMTATLPALANTALSQDSFVTAGACVPPPTLGSQVGSPRMISWYLAKSAAVIVAHCAPVTTVTVKPCASARDCSRLLLPRVG